MTYTECVQAFIADRKIAGVADKTIDFYTYVLKRYENNFDISDIALSTEHLLPYFTQLRESNLSDSTVHAQLRGLRAFYRFCADYEYIERVPKFPRVKTPKESPEPLTMNEVTKIINHIDRCKGFDDRRNGAIFKFMIDTGCRLMECLNIDMCDILWAERQVRVIRKGGKEQYLPFGRNVQRVLRSYVALRASKAKLSEQALWVTRIGYRMKPTALQTAFRRIGEALDIHLHPHKLRHTFATLWLENGGSEIPLQKLMGHETPAMTSRYGKIGRDTSSILHDRHSPGDRV